MSDTDQSPSSATAGVTARYVDAIDVLREKRDTLLHEAVEAHENGAKKEVLRCKEEARGYHNSINTLRESRGEEPIAMPTIEEVTGYPYRVTGTVEGGYPAQHTDAVHGRHTAL